MRAMKLDCSEEEFASYVAAQLSFFGYADVSTYIPNALYKVEQCFRLCTNKYYRDDEDNVLFSHKHSSQYCVFLYFLSKVAQDNGDTETACSLYLLNKMLNAIDIFYEVDLPTVFAVEHPVGTVLGRASYGNKLHISQGITIGNNHGVYPVIGDNVTVHFGASIIGNTHIGDNVEIAANTYIKDATIPPCCIVFGTSPNLIIKEKSASEMRSRLTHFVY